MARNLNLQVVLDTIDRATGPLKKIAGGSRGAGKAIRETRDHLRSLENAQKDLKGFANLKRSSEATATALDEQQRTVRDLTRQIDNAEGSTKQLTRQRSAAIRQARKLKNQYGKEQRQLQDLRGSMRRVDGVTGSLSEQQRELSRRVETANRRLEAQKLAMDRLGKARVGEKFRNMTSAVGRFTRQAALAGTIAGGGIFALANSTAALGDDVSKTADKLGIGIEALQEYRYAAERSGIATNTFDMATQRMVRRVSEAAQGTGEAQDALKELGLDAGLLASLSPDKQINRIADAMSAVPTQSDRIRLAMKLFDSEGVAMVNMLREGSDGLQELREQSRLTGYILSEKAARDAEVFTDRLTDARLSLSGMKNILGAELMPVISDLMKTFSEWMVENRDRVQAFARTFAERFREAVPTLISLVKGLAATAGALATASGVLANLVGGVDNLGIVIAALLALKPVLTIVAFGKALVTAGVAIASLATGLSTAVIAAKALKVALIASGIGAIIAGIAYAGYLLYKHWGPISDFVSNLWGSVRETIGGFLGWLGGLPRRFMGLGMQLMTGLKDGVLQGLTAAKDAVLGAGEAVIGWFKGKLGINSPSRVFEGFGSNTMQGYQRGIQRAERGPVQQINSVARRISQAGAGIALGGAIATSAAAAPVSVDVERSGNIAVDTRASLSAAPQQGGLEIHGGIHVNVTAGPGMDEEALAQHIASEVQRALDRAARQADARRRSAFHDID
ncbi:MAG: hypothetical protein WEB57_08165 [Pseudohongiellaceae bacterium]